MIDEKVLIAEIERQKSRLKPFVGIGSNVCGRIIKYLDALLVFTDSLQEEPVSEDLEEEIKRYCNKNGYTCTDDGVVYTLNEQIVNTARHFSEWQKQQIIKDAVDGEITIGAIGENLSIDIIALQNVLDTKRINARDKVKILIIKED